MMKVAPLFLLLALGLFGKASGESCACVAEEEGFTIDCADTDTMLEAMNILNSNSCATDCSSEECVYNYYIVQAHHDYCPEANIPELIEDGFHDFDSSCTGCDIKRDFVEGAPDCPPANCEDSSGNDAYTAGIEAGCNIDCSSDTCRDLYFTLRIVHDDCPHDVLSRAAEAGLHDLERPCAEQICNQASGSSSQLVCDPHAGHGDGAFEWAGVFAVADGMHQWSMQALDGEYADPSMRLVFFPTDTPDEEAIHSNEEMGGMLMEGDCTVVEAGETISGIAATGTCFELHVGSGEDSLYNIDTAGIEGIVVFAQHVPIEFERDMHYLKDSDGQDIEPVAEEGGDGHAHGHDDHGDEDESGVSATAAATATGVAALVGSILMA
jgi:hypothetical protein